MKKQRIWNKHLVRQNREVTICWRKCICSRIQNFGIILKYQNFKSLKFVSFSFLTLDFFYKKNNKKIFKNNKLYKNLLHMLLKKLNVYYFYSKRNTNRLYSHADCMSTECNAATTNKPFVLESRCNSTPVLPPRYRSR